MPLVQVASAGPLLGAPVRRKPACSGCTTLHPRSLYSPSNDNTFIFKFSRNTILNLYLHLQVSLSRAGSSVILILISSITVALLLSLHWWLQTPQPSGLVATAETAHFLFFSLLPSAWLPSSVIGRARTPQEVLCVWSWGAKLKPRNLAHADWGRPRGPRTRRTTHTRA